MTHRKEEEPMALNALVMNFFTVGSLLYLIDGILQILNTHSPSAWLYTIGSASFFIGSLCMFLNTL